MSNSLNKVTLIGHLGDDVKLHYFESGNCIGRFSVATNESYQNKTTGEKTVITDWHNIVVKNKLAELSEKYIGKGDRVYVEGKLKTRQWQDSQGNVKYATEIHANDLIFLSSKKEENNTFNSNAK
jgi:single-strand DNA-binding protein